MTYTYYTNVGHIGRTCAILLTSIFMDFLHLIKCIKCDGLTGVFCGALHA